MEQAESCGPAPRRYAVRVIAKKALRDFWSRPGRADDQKPLLAWWAVVGNKSLDWKCFVDIKATYSSADQVGECIVFNIGGNKYRLVAKVNYRSHLVFVRKVMTHREYDDQDSWFDACGCHSGPHTETPSRRPPPRRVRPPRKL